MKPGDTVVYLADRDLYGPGRYIKALRNGRMLVEFADGWLESFQPIELDTVARAYLTPEKPRP